MQDDRASIWRTNMILFLLRNGWLLRRHTFKQGRHGAVGPKPTTLLHANCPIIDVLEVLAQPMVRENLTPLIGRDGEGRF